MAGRSKQWLLIGAGAIFGSLTTAALLKILSRKVGKQQVGRHSTDFLMHNGMNGKENPAGGGRTGCQDIHNGLLGFDLEDEVSSAMVPKIPFLLVALALLLAPPYRSIAGATDTLESVPDLQRAMYRNIKSYPCVRLLNLSGEIGCSNPGQEKVIAPIVRFKHSSDELTRLSAVLLPLEKLEGLLLRISKDMDFAQKVAGVLVESDGYRSKSLGFSPAEKFPQAAFAPYKNINYEWNLAGSGIMSNQYNFPVFLLSPETKSVVQELAGKNAGGTDLYQVIVAEFDLVMQTTKSHTHDSGSCLKEQTCLPLGGFSVWSSLPPINISSEKPSKSILMAVASQDSASFFRDQSLGAESPISGLIALLAAVDALSRVDDLNELKKQLVFVVFTGEAWGYLGSRKFLQELDLGADAVNGLNNTLIEQVLEIGSVGKGLDQATRATTFYAHAGGDSPVTKDMLKALQNASDSLGSDNVKIKAADVSNPGIPPSSLMTFLRKNSSAAGIVLEDFDSFFTNKFYHTNINSSSIAAAAALVARTLYILASGDVTVNLMTLNSIKVNVSLVEELVGCLLSCEPGFSCSIVRNFISPSNTCPSHYVGVFLDSPDTRYPEYADDTSRFVWNFLADKTSKLKGSTSSCTGKCNSIDQVCIGAEIEGKGRCVISTTRYVPAYSTRLKIEDNLWHVIPASSLDPMGSVDPVWTESFWNTIGLRVYTVQSGTYDRLILVGGVGVTVASYIVTIVTKSFLAKAVKND
ncbi:Nicastrin [Musa troglodytarum]|uniref:Nicastrin n=1 Tax=Musa troglodytarum TaxID=320322 RepID=A0A9E7HJI5_9LILI|nr:Nicastrin [Musa troglodytarum]